MRAVTITLVATWCISLAPAHAGPFGREIEGRVANEEQLAVALGLARPEIDQHMKLRFGIDAAPILVADADEIATLQRSIYDLGRTKEWSRANSTLATISAWNWMRTRPEADPRKSFDVKLFLQTLSTIEYVKIESVPIGAKIRIKGHTEWNETNDDGYLPRGAIEIHLEKQGFKPIDKTENVKGGTNKFGYTLQME